MKTTTLFGLILASVTASAGAPKTITLDVDRMTCAACPITVRKSLEHVVGVEHVNVDINAHQAIVTFDPDATTADALATAVTNAGYPAHVVSHGR